MSRVCLFGFVKQAGLEFICHPSWNGNPPVFSSQVLQLQLCAPPPISMTFGKAYNTTITESWQVVQLEGACLTCMKPWYPTDRMTWHGV